jgi:hypothetical protein
MVGASLPVAAPPPGVAPVQVAGSASSADAEPVVPFSLDEGISEDARPYAAARAAGGPGHRRRDRSCRFRSKRAG